MLEHETARFAHCRIKPSLMVTPSGFLYDSRDAESYTLNATGMCIVRALLEQRHPDNLWHDLVEAFDVPESQARWDVVRFLADLKTLRLLEEYEETEA